MPTFDVVVQFSYKLVDPWIKQTNEESDNSAIRNGKIYFNFAIFIILEIKHYEFQKTSLSHSMLILLRTRNLFGRDNIPDKGDSEGEFGKKIDEYLFTYAAWEGEKLLINSDAIFPLLWSVHLQLSFFRWETDYKRKIFKPFAAMALEINDMKCVQQYWITLLYVESTFRSWLHQELVQDHFQII